ncbi:MAG: TatD family hydrolase [Candidatus Andersenbacteria bacterium]|nr:TatD family hydrolase [bacterium]MDZ4225221.1 TatD family hydrolase [Candidatus Andersenbacteria bacterium]
MIDSHAHVAFEAFDNDRDEAVARMAAVGVKGWIEIGADMVSSRQAVAMARKYSNAWATVGVHPDDINKLTENDWREMEQLITGNKVVAIGEVGLDYYRGGKREEQEPVLLRFIRLAVTRDLPVVWHIRSGDRDANEDLLEILGRLSVDERPRGVMHSFSGSLEQAQRYLELGLYVSFSGVVTFKNSGALPEVAKLVPLDRMLVETDAPFLAPVPHRGERNEPAYVRLTAEKIAQLRGVDLEVVDSATEQNTRKLFGLK